MVSDEVNYLELIAKLKTCHESFPTLGYAFSAVVLVGLWDAEKQVIAMVGSGFILDNKRGLIMTAAHTLMEIDKRENFGKEYYGNRHGKVVIGLIPENGGNATEAVYRYYARILIKDENIDKNKVCQVDACVLQITTKMESDVDDDRCGEVTELPIMHGQMKHENLNKLKLAEEIVDLNTSAVIIGFNQEWEGFDLSGKVNRCIDLVKGYVCQHKKYEYKVELEKKHRHLPTAETIVICETIPGHSGGPCIDHEGNVIGMSSRKSPNNGQRCYLVPSCELRTLLKKARRRL